MGVASPGRPRCSAGRRSKRWGCVRWEAPKEATGSEESVGQLFKEGVVQAAARALACGTAVLLVTALCLSVVKQEIKEGIEFGGRSALAHTSAVAVEDEVFNDVVLPKVKQNMREAIEYTIMRAERELVAAPPAEDWVETVNAFMRVTRCSA